MKSVFGRLVPFLSVICLSLAAFTAASFAQNLDNVTISGRVADSNNLPIVGASVTATQVETGTERTVVTNEDGRYQIIQLQPGTYNVKSSASGFGIKDNQGLVTISGQNVQLDFSLAPATVQAEQTVTIGEDDAPVVDTTRTVVGGTVTQREIEELPNNSRDPLDLVFTLGGVAEEPLSTRDLASDRGVRGVGAPGTTPEEAGIFSLSGGAAYSNNITIDGLDNNDDRTAGFRFQPSLESISEVQVITNQFSAEYGRASGGRVNIRTRNGSNKFRGRAFYFYRDARLNANTFSNNRRGIARPDFTNHDPGITLSGPIVKNKLFFFSGYEFDKILEDTIIDAFVPVTNGSRFTLPAPTNPGAAVASNTGANSILVAPYVQPFDTPSKRHIFSTRVDWNANSKNNFTFGYQLGRSNDLRQFSGTNRLADSLIGRVRNSDAFNLTHHLTISSKSLNEFRFQFSKLRPSSVSPNEQSPVILVTFTPPGETSSTTQIFGSSTSGSSDRKEDRLQFQDTLSYVTGGHILKFGGDVQRVKSQFLDRFDVTGTYRFSNFFFFNSNNVSSFQQNFNTDSQVKNTYSGVFFQDDWRIRPNVTFKYGVRYERESILKDNNNFGPRVSVAYNPFKGDKTVIRVGAGIFYNRVLLRTVDDFTAGSQERRFDSRNLPSTFTPSLRTFLSNQFPKPLTLDTVIPITVGTTTTNYTVKDLSSSNLFRSIDPTVKIPESYQFNVGFEREIFKGIAFETNFTINKTIRLLRDVNINAPVLPAGFNTFTDYLRSLRGPVQFELGSMTDTSGIRTAGGVTFINLNTLNNTNFVSSTTGLPTSPIAYALDAVKGLRPFASQNQFNELERVSSIGRANYRGITFELRNRYRKFGYGFAGSMRLVYTLSSLKDDGIVNTSSAQVNGNFDLEYGRSLQDRRHRLAFSGSFDTPKYLGGLRLSPVFRFGSSAPFNISIGGNDRNIDDVGNDRPIFNGNLDILKFRKFGTAFPADIASQFSFAPIGTPGNLPRNAGRGPRLYIFDLNVSRQFKITERFRLRPAIEFGNILNMSVFSFGSNFIDFNNLNSTNPVTVKNAQDIFLAPTRTFRPRQIRIGMRFEF